MIASRIAWFCLGLVIGGYWLHVRRLARKTRRRTGHSANFIPREPIGRMLRIIWVPAVLIWIACPFLAAASNKSFRFNSPLIQSPVLAWCGTLLAASCLAATTRCWRQMGKSWRMGIDPSERTELVATGPYARVAHPIYALSQAMMLASLLSLPSPLLFVAALIHIPLLHWEARREEQYMLQSHGPAYATYRASVGRFVPRLFGRTLSESAGAPR